MVRLICCLFLLLAGGFLAAQSSSNPGSSALGLPSIDARLFAAFDSVYLQTVRTSNPALVRRWNFYLDNAFFVTDFPKEKGDLSQLPVVQIADVSHINIFLLEKQQGLSHDWNRMVFYRINDSQRVLAYLPGKEFMDKFRKTL